MPFVTFVIPSLARDSLYRALASLCAQTDEDWEAVVIYDNCKATEWYSAEKRIWNLETSKGNAGETRNAGLDWFAANGDSEWVAFLDDDDYLLPTYVEHLRGTAEDHPWADLIVSRMKHPRYDILPLPGGELRRGLVGISFAVSSQLIEQGLRFVKEKPDELFHEDWEMISAVQQIGKVYLSPHCDYYVRDAKP